MKRVLLIVTLFFFINQTSYACSCLKSFDVEKSFNNASNVFEIYITKAQLIEVENEDVGVWLGKRNDLVIGSGYIFKTWKGDSDLLDGVITHSHDPACGITLYPGREYVLFVYETWKKEGLIFDRSYGIVDLCGSPYMRRKEFEDTIEWLENNIETAPNKGGNSDLLPQ